MMPSVWPIPSTTKTMPKYNIKWRMRRASSGDGVTGGG